MHCTMLELAKCNRAITLSNSLFGLYSTYDPCQWMYARVVSYHSPALMLLTIQRKKRRARNFCWAQIISEPVGSEYMKCWL